MTSLKARLARAKARLFGTAARDVAVPFDVACECGHRVAGIRRASYQLATCSACDSQIYVLPVNVYPATRRVQSEVIDGSVSKRVGTVVRDLVTGDRHNIPDEETSPNQRPADRRPKNNPDDVPIAEDTESRPQTGKRRKRSEASAEVATDEQLKSNARTPQPELPLLAAPRRTLGARVKKLFSPARLLAITGVVVLGATIWWNVHQRQMTNARKTWRLEMDLATAAMKKGDLVAVREALTKAVDAAQVLNRHDAESNDATSLLRQAEAVDQLTSTDFVNQFAGMTTKEGTIDAKKAQDVGQSLVGQRLLFETALVAPSNTDSVPVLDLPLIVEGVPVIISAPSKLLGKCAAAEPALSLLFIGTIAKCEAPTTEAARWLITLEGDSCTLITDEFFAKQLGYDVKNTQGLQRVLEHQAEFVKSFGVRSNEALSLPKRRKGN